MPFGPIPRTPKKLYRATLTKNVHIKMRPRHSLGESKGPTCLVARPYPAWFFLMWQDFWKGPYTSNYTFTLWLNYIPFWDRVNMHVWVDLFFCVLLLYTPLLTLSKHKDKNVHKKPHQITYSRARKTNVGRFANESFCQPSVHKRVGSIRKRPIVVSQTSNIGLLMVFHFKIL